MDPSEGSNTTSRLREFELLQAFKGVVPVPEVFWLDREAQWFPEPALVYAFAEALAADPAALTHQLRDAAMELAHAVAGVVQSAASLPPDVARRVLRIVLDMTEPELEFERLWNAPIGFETAPPGGKTLEDFCNSRVSGHFPDQ